MADSTQTAAPRFKGRSVELGGDTYIVPPLALGAVKELLPRIRDMKIPDAGLPSAETLDLMLEVIAAALRRNYPDVTVAQLADVVDLGNVGELFHVVMGASGFEPRAGKPEPGAA